MRLHYRGTYNLDPDSLPHKSHKDNAIAFKEPESSEKLALISSLISIVLLFIFGIPMILRTLNYYSFLHTTIGLALYLLTLFPHEILHAICFKEDVYLYTNLKQGLLFVVGPETMSKKRFIFMSLLPNLIFGLIPYIIYLLFPSLFFMGIFGTLALVSGSGDYLNVFNAITQMPKGSRCYLYKFNSYWYLPKNKEDV